jgi:hypothetical protein
MSEDKYIINLCVKLTMADLTLNIKLRIYFLIHSPSEKIILYVVRIATYTSPKYFKFT